MRVSEVMVRDPVTFHPDTPVNELAKTMRERPIASVVLVKEGKPVGIVTERDLVHRVLADGRDPSKLRAGEVCSKPVVAVSVYCDVEDAVDTMNDYKIRRLVVVDPDDKVAGILTTDDLGFRLRNMSEELAMKYIALNSRRRK
jgi:CBS domain-containing protein